MEALDMPTIIKLSGVSLTAYNLDNVKFISFSLVSLFRSEDLEKAITLACEDLFARSDFNGRTQVLIPCNTGVLTPHKFEEFLLDPKKYVWTLGEPPEGDPIYGNGNAAFLGKTVSGKFHSGFLVYDSGAGIVVDQINRDGASLMTPSTRVDYTSFLERQLGYSVSWRERALCEVQG